MKKSFFAKVLLIAVAAMSLHGNLSAANGDMTKIGNWYDDEDIRNAIRESLGDSVYIAPAIPDWPELMHNVVSSSTNEARSGRIALIPVNINDNHWAALAVRAKSDGTIVALYNDSLGHPISYSNMSGKYIEALRQLIPELAVIDLQMLQQDNDFSCGLFTAKNLIAFARLDEKELTAEAAREKLGKIREQVKEKNEVNYE